MEGYIPSAEIAAFATSIVNAARNSHPSMLGPSSWPVEIRYGMDTEEGGVNVYATLQNQDNPCDAVASLQFRIIVRPTGWRNENLGEFYYLLSGSCVVYLKVINARLGSAKVRLSGTGEETFFVPERTRRYVRFNLEEIPALERHKWLEENPPTFEFLNL